MATPQSGRGSHSLPPRAEATLMQNHHNVIPRNVQSAEERKRAIATAAPFIRSLGEWNVKVSRLRLQAGSERSSPEEKSLARLEAGGLSAVIRRRHVEFLADTKGEPRHRRLDDVDATFRRLLEQLEGIARPS